MVKIKLDKQFKKCLTRYMAKKAATKRRYHELTTPTQTSRLLTWLLLLLVPVIAFFLGMRYQESLSNTQILELKEEILLQDLESATPSADTVVEN